MEFIDGAIYLAVFMVAVYGAVIYTAGYSAGIKAQPQGTRATKQFIEKWGEQGLARALQQADAAWSGPIAAVPPAPVKAAAPEPKPSEAKTAELAPKEAPKKHPLALLRELAEDESIWTEHATDLRREGVVPQFIPPRA
ncbi:MAG: hypothetical protein KGL39_01570 [Patescibacteria group bacterium]|nr:hypothetical protein [Patescibacteria group bacterium]